MSTAELSYRIRQQMVQLTDRLDYWRANAVRLLGWKAQSVALMEPDESPWFFGLTGNRDELRDGFIDHFPEHISNAVRVAEAAKEGRIRIFQHEFELGPEINWHRHPISGRAYPRRFYGDVDTRQSERVGGILWHRELNRHYHFTMLAEAYFLSGKTRIVEALISQWLGWLDQNPPLEGVNWGDPLDISVRVINWCWAYNLVKPYLAQDPESRERILASLVQQVRHVARHPSLHSSANNHLIGEMAGIAVAALTFPQLFKRDLLEWSLDILEREIGRQVYVDGVPAEQSLGYLFFDFDLLFLVWQLASNNSMNIPEVWLDRLSAAAEFVSYVSGEDGSFPALGDDDEATALKFAGVEPSCRAQSFLTAASSLLGRKDLKREKFNWGVHNQWLFGNDGRRRFEGIQPTDANLASRIFPQGGYASLKTKKTRVIMDIGPLGYLSTAAHGHADALALLLWYHDSAVLIDSGTYAYQEGGKWRSYFRGTSAHNTLRVDGQPQSEMQGDFLWGRKAQVELLHNELESRSPFLVAEHDGYQQIGAIHRRAILLEEPGNLLVVDRLIGSGQKLIDQFWHLPVGAKLKLASSCVSGTAAGVPIKISWSWDNEPAELSIEEGREDPIQGWLSSCYGEKAAAPVVVCRGTTNLPDRWITLIQIGHPVVDDGPTMQEMLVRVKQRFEGIGL